MVTKVTNILHILYNVVHLLRTPPSPPTVSLISYRWFLVTVLVPGYPVAVIGSWLNNFLHP